VAEAGRSLDELRIAEVVKQDLVVAKGKTTFRVRVNLSFKVLREDEEVVVTEEDMPIITYDHF
jgi:flavin-binding protein dodecin